MLSPKPWNLETILRLLLGVFICLCLGSMAASGLHYAGRGGMQQVVFFVMLATAAVALAAGLVWLTGVALEPFHPLKTWRLRRSTRPASAVG